MNDILSKNSISLRVAVSADLDAIVDVFSRSLHTIISLPRLHTVEEERRFWRDVVMKEQLVTVAEQTGQVVGIMANHENWINFLYVDPDFFSMGIGATLVKDAQSRMEEIELWCFQQNSRARKLYERLGFIAEEFTDGNNNEEKMPDIRYRWSDKSE